MPNVSETVRAAIKELREHDQLHYERMMVVSNLAIGIFIQGGMYRMQKLNVTTNSLTQPEGGVWVSAAELLAEPN